MRKIQDPDKTIEQLQARVQYLEQINRLTLDALEQAARLGDFQTSINQMNSPLDILEETHNRIRRLIPFEVVAFYLVSENDSEFYLTECKPNEFSAFIKDEVTNYVENGTFAWAIREKRPVFVHTADYSKKILMHVLTTASRVRGMFLGVLTYGEMDVPLVSLSLMSIILLHSANALESFELYGIIKSINQNLEETIDERTRELQQSQEQLRHAQKMDALGRLAGGVAHDFNNMLTAINIASEMSLQEPGLSSEIKSNLKEILNATERASHLTRQLLAMSRKQVIKPRLLDLNAAIANTRSILSRLIFEDISIILEPGIDVLPIKADPGQVEQVLMNLALNARDAINDHPDPKEKKITIHVTNVFLDDRDVEQNLVSKRGNYALLRFSDTGTGMNEETVQRVFEPFFTTKGEGKGTGLGLATVYGIVTQNNGSITVESIPQEGTTFSIYWPCAETTDVLDAKMTPRVQVPRGSETILLVEDDNGIRKNVEHLLSSLGYTVYSAANGKAALTKLRKNKKHIDLLLTDIMMPIMDGRQLSESLREKIPGIKVIFTTGYTECPEAVGEGLPPNCSFIQKPYSVAQLSQLIRQLLD
ncbi:MAG: ATP-binding protein [Candidatus Omnitrophota bacterium]